MIVVGNDKDVSEVPVKVNPDVSGEQAQIEEKTPLFTGEQLAEETKVPKDSVVTGSVIGLGAVPKDLVITSAEKVAFLDSLVSNTRFEKSYSLFGGRLNLRIRSLTSAEVQALAAWAIKQGTVNPSDQLAGRFRKFLLTAQVAMFNGTENPPLEDPLFETLAKDGKTKTPPGWVDKCVFWDGQPNAIVQAAIDCLSDFDRRYSTMCAKANDENFWSPDTP